MSMKSNHLWRQGPAPADIVQNSPYCALHRYPGYLANKAITITGTGGEVLTNCFQITGLVEMHALWGVFTDVTEVTTMTGAYWDLWDGTNSVALCTGVAISGASLGSAVAKLADDASAATFMNASQTRYSENANFRQAFEGGLMLQKVATNTYVRFRVTTDGNTDAALQMWISWTCRFPGSTLAAV